MSWESQTCSFGDPNAQTPTPQQTPTVAGFPDSTLRTPQANRNSFDGRSGWTPIFAEDYTVFNATPGRLTNTQSTLGPLSPRPLAFSNHKQLHRSIGNLETGIGFQASDNLQSYHSPLDLAESSAAQESTVHKGQFGKTTPSNPNRQLREPFSGQTATPPQSAVRNSKKEAHRLASSNMHNDGQPYLQSGIMDQDNFLDFTQPPEDMFSYPMTTPEIPAYLNDKSFWDPDSSMADISMDFMANESSFYATSQQVSSSADWTQNHQMPQDPVNAGPSQQRGPEPLRRHRTLMAKPSASSAARSLSNTAFDFSMTSMEQDPFVANVSSGAVNPGLIFSFLEASSPLEVNQNHNRFTAQHTRPSARQTVQEPYEHQQREYLRDKEELKRSRSVKENVADMSYDGVNFGPPVESNRPVPRRSVSDSRPKKRGNAHGSQPPPNFAGKGVYSSGRQSPSKQTSRVNLASIPEAPGSNPRTSVTFSIDANGRARTETTIVMDGSRSTRKSHSRTSSDGWESPQSGSSTDEDPIMIPSRSASFNLPNKRGMPRMAQFDTSAKYRPRKAGSTNSSSQGDPDSESETVIDPGNSGDAASALRKVMGNRRRSMGNVPSTQTQAPTRHTTRHSFGPQAQYRRQSYAYQPPSLNASPTTITDPDARTPSTDPGSTESDTTRCVCNSRDGGEFMIQCESCEKWLHCNCVNVHPQRLPKVYICAFCVQTPNMRGPRIRGAVRATTQLAASPLAHKSFESWR